MPARLDHDHLGQSRASNASVTITDVNDSSKWGVLNLTGNSPKHGNAGVRRELGFQVRQCNHTSGLAPVLVNPVKDADV